MFLNKRSILEGLIFLLFFGVFVREVSSQDVSDIRTLLSTEGNVLYGNEQNSLLILDYPENIKKVEEYLAMVDVKPLQVLIEARVVEVKLQGEHALGVNWSAFNLLHDEATPLRVGSFQAANTYYIDGVPHSIETEQVPQQLTTALQQRIPYKNTYYPPGTVVDQENPFTMTLFSENINIVLQTLANTYDTNVLSAPKITTINNLEAEIRITRRLPWAEPNVTVSEGGVPTITWDIHFEDVGIVLRVTPIITEEGEVSMELEPEVSEKTTDYPLTVIQGALRVDYTVPVIDTRRATTKVVMNNGQTLILGGMIKEGIIKGVTKVPVLGDIPVLGWLFKAKKDTVDKTELLIFVSPTIITPEEFVRMEKKEKFGVGKWYMEDLKKKEEDIQKEENKGKEKFVSRLSKLEGNMQELSDNRKTIEKMISNQK